VSTDSDRREIYEKFQESKEYRDSFIAEHIYSRLPLKIRGLREQRGWSQKELGDKVGMAQAWVSKLEDPSYGKYTLATLLRLASAFDVGLDIDFDLFSNILEKALTLTPESFEVVSFADDPGFVEYRTGTVEPPAVTLVANQPHLRSQGQSDQRAGRNVLRPRDRPRKAVTTTDDTQSFVGRMPLEERDVTDMPKGLTLYAATAEG
jgi:transcriptional regulator with XRE-family HTH domain